MKFVFFLVLIFVCVHKVDCRDIFYAEYNNPEIVVLDNDPLKVFVNVRPVICNVENVFVALRVEGGTPPYSILWQNGSELFEDYIPSGIDFWYTVTDADNSEYTGYVSGDDTFFGLRLNSVVTTICNDNNSSSIELDISGGFLPYSILWSNESTESSLFGLSPGIYSVTITDSKNCDTIQTFEIFDSDPLLNPEVGNISCHNDGNGYIILDVTGGVAPYSYLWDNETTDSFLTNLQSGLYSVTVTDVNNCEKIDTFTIVEPDPLILDPYFSEFICAGDNNGFIYPNALGGTYPYSYIWNNNSTNSFLSGLNSGEYSVIVTDDNGCVQNGSWTITAGRMNAQYDMRIPGCLLNNGYVEILNVNGGFPPYTFSWSNGEGSSRIDSLYSNIYSLTIRDSINCKLFFSFDLIPEDPTIERIIKNVTCKGDQNGSINISVSDGIPPYTITWNDSSHYSFLNNLSGGSYSVTVVDSNNCSAVGNFNVVEAADSLKLYIEKENLICNRLNGDFFTTHGSLYLGGSGGIWIGEDESGYFRDYLYYVYDSTRMNRVISYFLYSGYFNFLSPGRYYAEITDAHGCKVDTIIEIYEPSKIKTEIIITDPTCFYKNDGMIEIDAVVEATPPYTYEVHSWIDRTSDVPIFEDLYIGYYNIEITDSNFCTYDTIVFLGKETKFCFNFPNAFTPNGDGINDTWVLEGLEYFADVEIKIFNRWGQKLFNSTDEGTLEWDGKYNNNFVPAGTYMFTITANAFIMYMNDFTINLPDDYYFSGVVTVVY